MLQLYWRKQKWSYFLERNTYVPLKSKTNYLQYWNIVCYGDISSATICFFCLCLCVLCTRRVVLIDSKSCLEACLQAGFSGNLCKEQRLLKHSKGFVGFRLFLMGHYLERKVFFLQKGVITWKWGRKTCIYAKNYVTLQYTPMLELVDKTDLKSVGHYRLCGFESHWGYKTSICLSRSKINLRFRMFRLIKTILIYT